MSGGRATIIGIGINARTNSFMRKLTDVGRNTRKRPILGGSILIPYSRTRLQKRRTKVIGCVRSNYSCVWNKYIERNGILVRFLRPSKLLRNAFVSRSKMTIVGHKRLTFISNTNAFPTSHTRLRRATKTGGKHARLRILRRERYQYRGQRNRDNPMSSTSLNCHLGPV